MSPFIAKKAAPLLCLLLFMVPLLSPAARLEDWTLDQVLDKIAEANGGKESIKSVTNARIRGRIAGPDNTIDFLLLKKRPDMMRLRLTYQGRAIEVGYNGTVGWRRVSQGENQQVTDIPDEDLAQMQLEADFDGPLVGPLPEGVTRTLVGLERIERVDYFIIVVKRPTLVTRHYVDSRTFRELKMIQTRPSENGDELETATLYFDYNRFSGIWIAMRSERHLPNGQVEVVSVEEVDVNPGILDRAFDKPEN